MRCKSQKCILKASNAAVVNTTGIRRQNNYILIKRGVVSNNKTISKDKFCEKVEDFLTVLWQSLAKIYFVKAWYPKCSKGPIQEPYTITQLLKVFWKKCIDFIFLHGLLEKESSMFITGSSWNSEQKAQVKFGYNSEKHTYDRGHMESLRIQKAFLAKSIYVSIIRLENLGDSLKITI